MTYHDFLESKLTRHQWAGIEAQSITESAKDYQKAIVKWALSKGRAAIFADCGLGKTLMQLDYARNAINHHQGKALILAPLAVTRQTAREAEKFNIPTDGMEFLNYEKLHKINPLDYCAVVLDESSILKSFTGAMRSELIDAFANTPMKLACTATPSPNDFMELGNHSEFLGIMPYIEMLAMYFIHDGGDTSKWRLKGHGAKKFWEWVATWAVMLKKPSDIGFEGDNFTLPELTQHYHCIQEHSPANGSLVVMAAAGLSERLQARRETIEQRVAKAVELRSNLQGQCVIWCELNDESEALAKALPNAVEVRGSMSEDKKADAVLDFAQGKIDTIITKPEMAAFGVNWQSCNNMIFMSVTDSFEATYQAIRRCWRYGQDKPVNVHYVYTERQQSVIENLKRKESQMEEMQQQMTSIVNDLHVNLTEGKTANYAYSENVVQGDGYTANLGDCVEGVSRLPDESIGYSVFSPPFASLYTYSNSERDMGNSLSDDDFYKHFQFLIKELYRVLKPGRLVSFHCMNLPTSKQNDGFIGIKDFRGDLIRAFQAEGFIYHSEVVIWKDPVTAMQRTKALGLLHKQIKKDSAMSRQGIPDYLVTMRKPGENTEPLQNTNETFPVDLWQQYASPVWMDINPSDTLQYREGRESDDERHICPLQLQVIERALKLWSREGDTVLSPFMGIGSEGYMSLKAGRKFIGFELKKSYFDLAVRNLDSATRQMDMFA